MIEKKTKSKKKMTAEKTSVKKLSVKTAAAAKTKKQSALAKKRSATGATTKAVTAKTSAIVSVKHSDVTKKSKSVSKKMIRKKSMAKSAHSTKASAQSEQLETLVGQKLPPLKITATGSNVKNLHDLKGKYVVLYFYPKDATPGCTIEGHEFTRLYPQFQKLGAEVLGVSRDSLKSHEKFKTKEAYCFDLISDEAEELCSFFGVMKNKNMYGKMVRGIERSTFIMSPELQVIKEWRGVKAEGHAQAVLAELQNWIPKP